mmetsp:Transcript_122183/g.317510  ORF Transcript_122183/g.317510 Transcript_122183/m.317510 type:complete len:477 (-) Transcript_122183:69-1499(-)
MAAEQPESHSQWAASTQANMTRARSLARDVLDRLRQHEAADAANKKALEDSAKREKERVRAKVQSKVKANNQVISGSQKQMKEIEEAMVQAEGVHSRLTHERYARFACLKVCERRLELRQGRPARELFHDATQDALERERQVLNNARKELLQAQGEARRTLDELKAIRSDLSRETGSRRLAMHHDLATMRSTLVPVPMMSSSPSSSSAAPAHGCMGLSTSASAPSLVAGAEQHEAPSSTFGSANPQQQIQRSVLLVESVYALKRRSEHMIVKIREESRAATKRVAEALAKRTKELSDMKKQFEAHLADVEHTHAKAERALAVEEARVDPTAEDATQQERLEILRSAVRDLASSKENLTEDLRNKIAALDIDNSCRRCTPQMACEPKKLQPSASSPSLNFRATNGLMSMTAANKSFYTPSMASSSHMELADADSAASTATPAPRTHAKAGTFGGSSSLKAAAGLLMPSSPTAQGVSG